MPPDGSWRRATPPAGPSSRRCSPARSPASPRVRTWKGSRPRPTIDTSPISRTARSDDAGHHGRLLGRARAGSAAAGDGAARDRLLTGGRSDLCAFDPTNVVTGGTLDLTTKLLDPESQAERAGYLELERRLHVVWMPSDRSGGLTIEDVASHQLTTLWRPPHSDEGSVNWSPTAPSSRSRMWCARAGISARMPEHRHPPLYRVHRLGHRDGDPGGRKRGRAGGVLHRRAPARVLRRQTAPRGRLTERALQAPSRARGRRSLR